jgi:hypothetical protein
MKLKPTVLKKFYVATLVCGLFAGAGGVPEVMAGQRNRPNFPLKPDFPHKPRDPLADLQHQVKTLNTNINALKLA